MYDFLKMTGQAGEYPDAFFDAMKKLDATNKRKDSVPLYKTELYMLHDAYVAIIQDANNGCKFTDEEFDKLLDNFLMLLALFSGYSAFIGYTQGHRETMEQLRKDGRLLDCDDDDDD